MRLLFAVLALTAMFALLGPLSTASADLDSTLELSPSPDTPDAEVTSQVIGAQQAAEDVPNSQLEASRDAAPRPSVNTRGPPFLALPGADPIADRSTADPYPNPESGDTVFRRHPGDRSAPPGG